MRVMPNFLGQWPTTSEWRYQRTPAKFAMFTSVQAFKGHVLGGEKPW